MTIPLKEVKCFEGAHVPLSNSGQQQSFTTDGKTLDVSYDEKLEMVVLTALRQGKPALDKALVYIPMTNVRSMRGLPKEKPRPLGAPDPTEEALSHKASAAE